MGILQARILERVAMPSSRASSQTQGLNPGLPHIRQILYHLGHQGSPNTDYRHHIICSDTTLWNKWAAEPLTAWFGTRGQYFRPDTTTHWGEGWGFLKLPTLIEDCLIGGYPEKTLIEKGTCTPMFTAVLFTIARAWTQTRCPLTDEWTEKILWNIP